MVEPRKPPVIFLLKKRAPAEAVGCIINHGQEAKTEILANSIETSFVNTIQRARTLTAANATL